MDFKRIEKLPDDVSRRFQVPAEINRWALRYKADYPGDYENTPTIKHLYLNLMQKGLELASAGQVEFSRQFTTADGKEAVLFVPLAMYKAMEVIAEEIKNETRPKAGKYNVSTLDVMLCLLKAGFAHAGALVATE